MPPRTFDQVIIAQQVILMFLLAKEHSRDPDFTSTILLEFDTFLGENVGKSSPFENVTNVAEVRALLIEYLASAEGTARRLQALVQPRRRSYRRASSVGSNAVSDFR
jgi:hypothetical protein